MKSADSTELTVESSAFVSASPEGLLLTPENAVSMLLFVPQEKKIKGSLIAVIEMNVVL